jgi:hypothetical protein
MRLMHRISILVAELFDNLSNPLILFGGDRFTNEAL